jgi:Flp pilus assembly protein TadB
MQGPDYLRVGDAERDEMTEALHEHFAKGRLTAEELDERLSATLAARTVADLRAVDADLPDTRPEPIPAGPPRHFRGHHGFRPPIFFKLTVLALIFAAVAGGHGGHGALVVLRVVFLVALFGVLFSMLRFRRMRRMYRTYGPPPWARHHH